jgi:hypothetical protein
VACPLCEYDLRGLAEPRCPECGYRFTWEELRDPSRRIHPYLFEHHPERNVRSFFDTLAAGMRPQRFWSTLYPTQPSRPGRLLSYWVIAAPLTLATAAHGWLTAAGVAALLRTQRFAPREPFEVARWTVLYDIGAGGHGLLAVMCLAWPWLTLAALLVFQVSLRRARLKGTHVLRCVLYAGDLCLWVAPLMLLLVLIALLSGTWPPRASSSWAPLVAGVLVPWLFYRLHTAYRLYLRFDHAGATVLASQVIVALVYWKLWLVAEGY